MDDDPQTLQETIRRYRRLIELNTDVRMRHALEETIEEMETKLRDRPATGSSEVSGSGLR